MMDPVTILALHLAHVTGPYGRDIAINPEQVVAVRKPRDDEKSHPNSPINCLIYTTDGKFVGVRETCPVVIELLEQARGQP